MESINILIDTCFPKATPEDMVVAIVDLIVECDEDAKQAAEEDILQDQIEKTVWVELCSDVYDHGLHAELCEFVLEHPEYNAKQIDYHFRREWDL